MKKNKTNNKTAGESSARSVHIEFTHANAMTISIAGTFNDWRPGATPMVSLGDGRWFKDLMLKPGVYEYRLVVDGEWMPDPRAGETAPNPFGEMNSVLKVNGCASDIVLNGIVQKIHAYETK
jgi:1,4-alpha-glucan branching enzyme